METMVDALEVSPQRVLVELGDFALSVTGRRRWAPEEHRVSVRVAAARLVRGAKRAAQYYAVRGKETVDYLALAVGTLVEDLPHMRRRLGDAHPEVLAFEGHLGELRAALRARQASRPATLCTIYVQALTNVPHKAGVSAASARVSASARAIVSAFSGQKLCLKVRPGDTVLSLKQKIRDSTNIPLERQRLIISGRQLVDGKRLYESNVFDGTTVHLVLRPPPGGWCSKWWGE
jgi:hypothetical protein